MSYILEALKKAQAERSRGSIPDIGTHPLAPTLPDTAARRSPLLLGGVAVVVLGAAIAVGWFALAQHEEPSRVKLTAGAAQGVAAPALSSPGAAVPAGAAPPAPSAQPAPPRTTADASTAVPRQSPSVATSRPSTAATSQAQRTPVAPPVASVRPTPAAPPKPAPEARTEPVALLQDLPPQIQREIPTLAVNGYIYASNPADRSVLINNRLRREGDQVAPGLTLEKLLPKEMVLNYRGYRYRIAY